MTKNLMREVKKIEGGKTYRLENLQELNVCFKPVGLFEIPWKRKLPSGKIL